MYGSKLFSKRVAVACACVVASFTLTGGLAVATAGANALGGVASEVTQILNNVQLSAQVQQQVQTVSQLVGSYTVQLKQLEQQILSGTGIDPARSQALLSTLKTEMNSMGNYQSALKTMGIDLGSLSTAYSQRFAAASLGNMSMKDYVQFQVDQVRQGNTQAQARLSNEVRLMQSVNNDYDQVRQWGSQIDSTVGEQGSVQLLNLQMNRLVQQNARMIEIAAQANNSDVAARQVKEGNDDAMKQQAATDLQNAASAIQQRQSSGFNALGIR